MPTKKTQLLNPDELLNDLQLRFVEEYLHDPSNQEQAAVRAGYKPSFAKYAATRLMKDQRILRMINDAKETWAEKVDLTKERVLQELMLVAFAPTPQIGEEVNIKIPMEAEVTSMDDGKGRQMKTTKVRTIKPSDKTRALELLGKQLGMFKDQIDVNSKLTLEDLVKDSLKSSEEATDAS